MGRANSPLVHQAAPQAILRESMPPTHNRFLTPHTNQIYNDRPLREIIDHFSNTMRYNVAQLLKEPVGSTRHQEVTPEDGVEVTGNIEMLRTDRSILVRGQLDTSVETECSRCLCFFKAPVTIQMEDEFYPTIDVESGVPLANPEDPDAFSIDSQHILDLSEAVRQYAGLSLPMKPLCRPDCRGLCPKCGRNLNEGQCPCPENTTDARWAKLQELFPKVEIASRRRDTEAARAVPKSKIKQGRT